jgi:hypothetical protein
MKSKEKQYDFNVKLMQRLDGIQKKMDKKIETCKSIIHRSHDEKIREARSIDMKHYHSPTHSLPLAQERSISSPSPV